MKTETLQTLIDQVQELGARLAQIDNDEAQFTRDRQAIIDGGDYSSPSVAKVGELDTRLAIIPAARAHLYAQQDTLHQQLRGEINTQQTAFFLAIHAAAEKKQTEVAALLKPYSETPGSASALAGRADAVLLLRQDAAAIQGIGGAGDIDLPETVGAAQSLIRAWAVFQEYGRLARPNDDTHVPATVETTEELEPAA